MANFSQKLFSDLADKVVPVLRDANVKFKKHAVNKIIAYPSISDEAKERFNSQFSRKGRSSITVDVKLKDTEGTLTCITSYNWFVQKI